MRRDTWCLLTEPVPLDWRERAKRVVRRVLAGRLDGEDLGHPGVTRSLARGLRRVGRTFTLNPLREQMVGRVCIVLSSIGALRQAIEWKQGGRIELLLAGPNLVVRANEHDGILGAPQVDACLVPSDWVATAYLEDMPTLSGRIHVWFAGVNENYWVPRQLAQQRRNALIYCKNAEADIVQCAETVLARAGWPVLRVNYGDYTPGDYRKALDSARFAVFLSASESQGLALAEAWAMDVPTLAWQPRELIIDGRRYTTSSASPYLNDKVGVRWATGPDLERLLAGIAELLPHFSPRAWIRENMTDDHAGLRMNELVHELLQTRALASRRLRQP